MESKSRRIDTPDKIVTFSVDPRLAVRRITDVPVAAR